MAAAPKYANQLKLATSSLVAAAGPLALYCGYAALQCRQAVWTAVYFASRPMLTDLLSGGGEVTGLATFGAGLGAGVLGAVANCPFDVSRSVAQKACIAAWQAGEAAPAAAPVVGAALAAGRNVVRTRGVGGLWAGIGFKSLHLGCGGALMAVLQPKCEAVWARLRS